MDKIIDGIYVGAHLEKTIFERFRRVTFEKNVSKSAVIRKLIEDWLKKEEKKILCPK
ncbi:MAG: hypothetical protein KA413_00185 [Candidatus Methylopumilus sp.]|nr:hypothetical protein [Candidatus Methylopumilus sp.]